MAASLELAAISDSANSLVGLPISVFVKFALGDEHEDKFQPNRRRHCFVEYHLRPLPGLLSGAYRRESIRADKFGKEEVFTHIDILMRSEAVEWIIDHGHEVGYTPCADRGDAL